MIRTLLSSLLSLVSASVSATCRSWRYLLEIEYKHCNEIVWYLAVKTIMNKAYLNICNYRMYWRYKKNRARWIFILYNKNTQVRSSYRHPNYTYKNQCSERETLCELWKHFERRNEWNFVKLNDVIDSLKLSFKFGRWKLQIIVFWWNGCIWSKLNIV